MADTVVPEKGLFDAIKEAAAGSAEEDVGGLVKELSAKNLELSVAKDVKKDKEVEKTDGLKGVAEKLLNKAAAEIAGFLFGSDSKKLEKANPGAEEKMNGMSPEALDLHVKSLEQEIAELRSKIEEAVAANAKDGKGKKEGPEVSVHLNRNGSVTTSTTYNLDDPEQAAAAAKISGSGKDGAVLSGVDLKDVSLEGLREVRLGEVDKGEVLSSGVRSEKGNEVAKQAGASR